MSRLFGATETQISARFHALATKAGLITIKLSTLGRFGESGWPDRMVLGPERRVVFIEFKRPGGKPTPRQKEHHERLRKLGFEVYVEHDSRAALARVEGYFLEAPQGAAHDDDAHHPARRGGAPR